MGIIPSGLPLTVALILTQHQGAGAHEVSKPAAVSHKQGPAPEADTHKHATAQEEEDTEKFQADRGPFDFKSWDYASTTPHTDKVPVLEPLIDTDTSDTGLNDRQVPAHAPPLPCVPHAHTMK